VSVDDENIGRIVFELADDILPRTVGNFKVLCEAKSTEKYAYKGTKFHHILKGSLIMGGDVEKRDGSGSHSADPENRFFKDENFIIPHSSKGLLRYENSLRRVNINRQLLKILNLLYSFL